MNTLASSLKRLLGAVIEYFNLPTRKEIRQAVAAFSVRRKLVLTALFAVFLTSALGVLWSVNRSFTVTVAAEGGTLSEGVIGSPRLINPLLALSDADRDLAILVYSGLMRLGPDNSLIPDLAKEYSVSEDGRTYTFVLREDLTWHDGEPLTADDIVFTVRKAQDSLIKSPKRATWEGVAVEAPSPMEVVFRLKQPYAFFLENTTLGILPKHLWGDLSAEAFPLSDFNTNPIGSGPYRVAKIKKDPAGLPLYYNLKPFEGFALGEPKISTVRLRFYPDEKRLLEAFDRNEITSIAAVSPAVARDLEDEGARILTKPLPRVFGVFFNPNQSPALADRSARKALDLALDKQAIVDSVLRGYGSPASGPLPPSILAASTTPAGIEAAKAALEEGGWAFDGQSWTKKTDKGETKLAFSIATSDTPELKQAGEMIKKRWQELGAEVELQAFEIGNLNQNVIRPRKYDALFFGEILGRVPDPFPFWHSSQRLDPGLNIALYANAAADKILERTRSTLDPEERRRQYAAFSEEIGKDYPATFVYSPDFLYAAPKKLERAGLPTIAVPAERFSAIHRWHLKTDRLWKIFADEKDIISN